MFFSSNMTNESNAAVSQVRGPGKGPFHLQGRKILAAAHFTDKDLQQIAKQLDNATKVVKRAAGVLKKYNQQPAQLSQVDKQFKDQLVYEIKTEVKDVVREEITSFMRKENASLRQDFGGTTNQLKNIQETTSQNLVVSQSTYEEVCYTSSQVGTANQNLSAVARFLFNTHVDSQVSASTDKIEDLKIARNEQIVQLVENARHLGFPPPFFTPVEAAADRVLTTSKMINNGCLINYYNKQIATEVGKLQYFQGVQNFNYQQYYYAQNNTRNSGPVASISVSNFQMQKPITSPPTFWSIFMLSILYCFAYIHGFFFKRSKKE